MDIPNYVTNSENSSAQENYNQQLNATLQQNLGQLGFNITPITVADLTATSILDPNTGALTTVQDLALIGSVWFVKTTANATAGIWVGKMSSGPTVLQQFTTVAYP